MGNYSAADMKSLRDQVSVWAVAYEMERKAEESGDDSIAEPMTAADADVAVVGAITGLIGRAQRRNPDDAYTERLIEIAKSILARRPTNINQGDPEMMTYPTDFQADELAARLADITAPVAFGAAAASTENRIARIVNRCASGGDLGAAKYLITRIVLAETSRTTVTARRREMAFYLAAFNYFGAGGRLDWFLTDDEQNLVQDALAALGRDEVVALRKAQNIIDSYFVL